jgi:hypothetical protein
MWRRIIYGGIGGIGLAVIGYLTLFSWLLFTAYKIHNANVVGGDYTDSGGGGLVSFLTHPDMEYHFMPPGMDMMVGDGPDLRLRLTSLGPQVVIRSIEKSVNFSFARLSKPWADMPRGDVSFSDIRLVDGSRQITLDGHRDADGVMAFDFNYQSPFIHISGRANGQWKKSITLTIESVYFPNADAQIKRAGGWVNWDHEKSLSGQVQAGLFQIGDDLILSDISVQLDRAGDKNNVTNLSIRARRATGAGGDYPLAAELSITDTQASLNIHPGDVLIGDLHWIDPVIHLTRNDNNPNQWSGRITSDQSLYDQPITPMDGQISVGLNPDDPSVSWNGVNQSGQWTNSDLNASFRNISLPIGTLKHLTIGDGNQVTGKLNDGKGFSGRITGNDQFIGTVSNMAVELDINDWFGRAESNDIPITMDRIQPIFFPLPVTGIKNGRADVTVNINGKRHETTADFRFDQISILNQMIGGLNGTINLSDKTLTASYPRPAAGKMEYSPDTGWSIEHPILGGDIKCITPHLGVGAMGDHSICNAVIANISLDQVLDLTSAHMLEASGTLNGTVQFIRDVDRVKIGDIRLSGTTRAISLADGGALSGDMADVNQHLKNLALDEITVTRRPAVLDNHEKPIKLTARGHRPDGQAVKLTLHLDIISDQLDRLIK